MPLTKKQIGFWILSIIVVPFLSNAFWELFGRLVFNLITQGMLNILSSIHADFRNSVYKEIARGFHEQNSLSLYLAFLFLMLVVVSMYSYSRFTQAKVSLNSKNNDTTFHEMEESDLDNKLTELNLRIDKIRKRIRIISACLMLNGLLLIFPLLTSFYINGVVTHHNQSVKIISPFISELELKTLESNFASIQDKEGFVKINQYIAEVGKKNGKAIETDWIW